MVGTNLRAISEDEFQRWIPARDTLNMVGAGDWNVAAEELVRQVFAGRIRAATNLSWGRPQRHHFDRAIIDPDWWGSVPGIGDPSNILWVTGAIQFFLQDSANAFAPEIAVSGFGTRLEPVSILAAASAPTATVPQKDDRKPLPVAEMKRFASVYHGVFAASATETKAVAAVRAAYPDNSVGRDAFLAEFRAIRGAQTPGPKPKTEE
jgi:hypothetical protein